MSKAKPLTRTNIYLTEAQKMQLEAIREDTGISVAELTRRAIDMYIDATLAHTKKTGRAG